MAARPEFPAMSGGAVFLLFWLTNPRQYCRIPHVGSVAVQVPRPRKPESWPTAVGQEKRQDGRPAQSQARISGSPAIGTDPPDGGWSYSRRAAARRLLGGPGFEPVRFPAERGTRGPAAAAACG